MKTTMKVKINMKMKMQTKIKFFLFVLSMWPSGTIDGQLSLV